MRKQIIYRSIDDDLIYVNNLGKEYILAEAVNPAMTSRGTYDIIVALPINEDGEFGNEDAKWFAGAFDLEEYLKGKNSDFLDSCKDFLDVQVVKDAEHHPIVDVFYTGGGIYCGILKVKDGWFMGETNSYGCIFKTYEDAVESCPTTESLVRYVESQTEQIAIWVELYSKFADRLDAEGTDIHAEMWELIDSWESSLYHDISKS